MIETSSVLMKPTVRVPIHAATAMLTATVMSMIDAITGLRAFLFCLFMGIFTSSG